jgi:hyaluronoglucosaminidase
MRDKAIRRRHGIWLGSLAAGLATLAASAVPALAAPGPQGAAQSAASPRAASPALPQVWPAPQQMRARPGSVEIPAVAGEVVGHDTDPSALSTLNSVLRADGVHKIVVSDAGSAPPQAPVTFYVGTPSANPAVGPALAGLHVAGPQGLPDGGYVLAAGRDGGHATVVLAGADGAGTFYAVQTLRQLLVRRGPRAVLRDVAVRDWPAMPIRGVIEGFYGPPWSTADRISQFVFDGELKMNTYVYSPKDDPYLRAQWRQPYPPAQLAVIKKLVDAAAANHVTFTYALSPGLSICYSSASDLNTLIAKLQSIWDIGVRAFAIPFDDINYGQWNCSADQAAFGSPGPADAAKAQVHVLNAVQRDFIDTHPGTAPLEFVPTEYYNTTASPYKQVIASTLDPKVIVEWTGEGVVVPQITGSQAQSARQVFGHPILVWDNYPVNDYATDRLFMGPYNGRAPDLAQYLAGITANPMIEEEASKVALYTAGAYFWNPPAYDADPGAAWLAGIKMIGGRVWPALEVFADNNYSSTLNSQESPALTPLIAAFWQAWNSDSGLSGAAARLSGYFSRMAAAPGQLRSGMPDPGFLTEVKPWLDKLGLYGQAGQAAVAMLLAERAGNGPAAARDRGQLGALQARIGAIPQQVAPGVMDPFLARAEQASEQSAAARVTVTTASPLARPGASVTVTTTVTDTGSGSLAGIQAGLTAPPGWQVAPSHPASLGTASPGGSARAQWTVTAPADAAPGSYTLTAWASFTAAGTREAVLGHGPATVPYASLAKTFGNVGITDDSDTSPADLDGGLDGDGSTFSAQELATHGLTPGSAFTYGGVTFTWPDVPAGEPDNTLADGQAITVTGSGSTLGLLTIGSYATSRVGGTGEVVYSDGSTQPFTITDPDWQFGPLTSGDHIAVTTSYHNLAGTGRISRTAYIFFHAVPLNTSKTVAAVILPTVSDHATGGTPSLHVFAIAVG